MATLKQQKLAKEIVETFAAKKTKTAQELLVSAGYDQTTAEASPGRTISQKGVKEELFKLGFDTQNANRVVAEILNDETNEPKDRLKAAELVYKVQGDFAPEKHITITKKIISIDE